MKLLALTIGTGQNGEPGFHLQFPSQITKLNSTTNLPSLITDGLGILLTASVLLAFVFLLVGGIRWIMSGGDKKQLETAQKTIQYALIGLVVVLLSFFIINLVGFIFGVNLLKVQVP